MNIISKGPMAFSVLALLAAPASISAQQLPPQQVSQGEDQIDVYGSPPADLSGLTQGPEFEGMISARRGDAMQITAEDGTNTMVRISTGTEVRSKSGLFGMNRNSLGIDSLLNGLPVKVETVQWGGNLVASRVQFQNNDLETASMIHGATSQQFGEHSEAIESNAAATEALRGRVANIDQYNIMGTTNVYYDTGKWRLTPSSKAELCNAAAEAEAMDNALLLVVGYTDSVGSQEFNQTLSERRAGRVVNFLQQECSWAPYRMLTPTGMAEADPLADNTTAEGRRQNRRVSVNILVSKALDGM